MTKFIIEAAEAGTRLDQFAANKVADWSRSQLAKNIKAGIITVNGQPAKAHYFLKKDDVVEVGELTISQPLLRQQEPLDLTGQIEIIAETPEYLVVNKPAGLIVHYPTDKPGPEVSGRNPSLVDWLVARHPEVAKVGDDPSRPGIVHRLDKAVSGLMVLALTQDSFDNLKRQFQKRQVEKHYQALVYGQIAKAEDRITFPLERSASGKKMAARPMGSEGKVAITEFKILERLINYTFIEVNLKTGRTHQIRAHMAAYGNPIVGDRVYSTANTRRLYKKTGLDRIFLNSVFLSFTDLAGVRKSFEAPLNAELQDFLAKAK